MRFGYIAMAIALGGVFATVAQSGTAPAKPGPGGKTLSLALATEAAFEAVATCQRSGFQVTATIFDETGAVKLVAQGDVAQPGSRKSTPGIAPAAGAQPQQFPPHGAMPATGGVLLKSGENVVGVIGVVGAPGDDKDEVCAKAGAAKIADRLG